MKKLNTASPNLLAPLQGLWRWLMPTTLPRNANHSVTRHEFPVSSSLESSKFVKQHPRPSHLARTAIRPLRVVRILEPHDIATNNVGRMLISGRMADVCAELDRLVAHEQTLH